MGIVANLSVTTFKYVQHATYGMVSFSLCAEYIKIPKKKMYRYYEELLVTIGNCDLC